MLLLQEYLWISSQVHFKWILNLHIIIYLIIKEISIWFMLFHCDFVWMGWNTKKVKL